jgi:nitrite reductase/ring-hydroxylating ferredoxin subunit
MRRVRVCESRELPERGAVRFQVVHQGRESAAFAVRFQGELRGYVNLCTHREMELDLGEGRFFSDDGRFLACRAHGALYDPLLGTCVGGICRRGATLATVPVQEEGGVIWAGSEEP